MGTNLRFQPPTSMHRPERSASLNPMVNAVLEAVWAVILLPFRLLYWLVEILGRVTAFVLGFIMMVVGVALWGAGPLFIIGVPLFVVGLLITLRSLGGSRS